MGTDKKIPGNIEESLKRHNQSHLLAFWGQLDDAQRQKLAGQIEQLDFAKIDDWVANLAEKAPSVALPAEFAPAQSYGPNPIGVEQQEKYARARELGRELISAGKVAAFVVAGGQGTRLGFDGPKGDFPISPVKNKTLFQIFAESIEAVSKKYGINCPWYIMTSPMNHAETCGIFRKNDYYGLREDDVFIFQQGTLPNFSFDGKILMADRSSISCSPDGHGGSLKALFRSGAIAEMKRRGVEFISYFQVDNSLINIFDPLFIGLHSLDGAEMSSKAVVKAAPEEKVGVFCLVDGKVTVIEYSDLSDEQVRRKNPDGSLVFGLGSIAIHIINRSFIEKLNAKGFSLALHKAAKKIAHINDEGNFVEPTEPNGIKLESFVFDALPFASKSIILQTLREQEFGPVKNATGRDSVETAREMIVNRAADWLESAGVTVPRRSDGSVDAVIEIASSFVVEKDEVKDKLSEIPEIKPGDRVYLA